MIRATLLMIAGLGAVVAVMVWLGERPGTVVIRWQGWLIEMSVGHFVLAAGVFLGLAVLAFSLLHTLMSGPRRIRSGLRARRRERGYRALTHGMVAVAAGDRQEAQRQARRADSLLDEPPLTMLLSAQSAQLNGDEAAARHYFSEMLQRSEMAFLGLRGLLVQAQRDGDREAALRFAQQADKLRPGTPWVLETLFELHVSKGEWKEALRILEQADKYRVMKKVTRQQRASVLLGCSDDAEKSGESEAAFKFAQRAHAQASEYLPTILRVVDLLVREGKKKRAIRMIHDAWSRQPHPSLAQIYGEVGTSDDAFGRVRDFEKLLSFNVDHEESHIALAEASLEANLWGEARNHLAKATGSDPSARVCRLMAGLEEREHEDMEGSRTWLLRASQAGPDSAWVCGDCGAAWEFWSPVCKTCDALGTLTWRPPARARSNSDISGEQTGELLLTESDEVKIVKPGGSEGLTITGPR